MSTETLDNDFTQGPKFKRRRNRMPLYIKIFCWVFMGLGVLSFLMFLNNAIGDTLYTVTIFGIDAYRPFTIKGILVMSLYLGKAIVGFGLWTEKHWGTRAAQWDGLISGLLCIVIMILPFISDDFIGMNLRLELLLILPYFNWAKRNRRYWEATPESLS